MAPFTGKSMLETVQGIRDLLATHWAARHCIAPFRRFRGKLPAYAFTRMPGGEREEMERHVEQCYACSREFRRLRRMRARLRTVARKYARFLQDGTLPEEQGMRDVLIQLYLEEWTATKDLAGQRFAFPDRAVSTAPVRPGSPVLDDEAGPGRFATLGGFFHTHPHIPALAASCLVLILGGALWIGLRHQNMQTAAPRTAGAERLLPTATRLASHILCREPLIDLRSSFGPEMPVAALLLERGYTESTDEENRRALEDLLQAHVLDTCMDSRLASATGLILVFEKRVKDARRMMERALALRSPGDSDTLLDVGVIALLLSDFALAENCFSHALRVDSLAKRAQYNLARLYEITGKDRIAREAWQRYVEMDSTSIWTQLAASRIPEVTERTKAQGDVWPPWKE